MSWRINLAENLAHCNLDLRWVQTRFQRLPRNRTCLNASYFFLRELPCVQLHGLQLAGSLSLFDFLVDVNYGPLHAEMESQRVMPRGLQEACNEASCLLGGGCCAVDRTDVGSRAREHGQLPGGSSPAHRILTPRCLPTHSAAPVMAWLAAAPAFARAPPPRPCLISVMIIAEFSHKPM